MCHGVAPKRIKAKTWTERDDEEERVSYEGSLLAEEPNYVEDLVKVVTPLAMEARLHCPTTPSDEIRIVWMLRDPGREAQRILSYHRDILVLDPRLSVTSRYGNTDWILHIKNVTTKDQGVYTCQVNTKPPRKLLTFLEIVVPPKFVEAETTLHATVSSGDDVRLTCEASGTPTPNITWQRVDAQLIHADDGDGRSHATYIYQGRTLLMSKVKRHQMASYQCVASNGVIPSISRVIEVRIRFAPIVSHSAHVYARMGSDLTLSCDVASYPTSTGYWYFKGSMVQNVTGRHVTRLLILGLSKVSLQLQLYSVRPSDLGRYACIVSNGGESKSKKGAIDLLDIKHHPSASGETSRRRPNHDIDKELIASDDGSQSEDRTRHGHGQGPQSGARTAHGKKDPGRDKEFDENYGSRGNDVKLKVKPKSPSSSQPTARSSSSLPHDSTSTFISIFILLHVFWPLLFHTYRTL